MHFSHQVVESLKPFIFFERQGIVAHLSCPDCLKMALRANKILLH
ncbi:MAG: hypothetical protein AVDCRST_MAG91-688 [uncultured Sphingomonadaceae bacterium]|uniref:Uncharacterized protein n=1 Tax=uncultured Sphingomonadaceae bacterium TaxID=169976 RepID=A0A6J4SBA4_9SPHN|nr:MAG: hypothetical protein AVDCRST_MAG91-688 [uncultured Sphingomonadaceae bacterium]